MATPQFLVPVDCSSSTDVVLETAIRLAHKLQARLILLHVRDETSLHPGAYMAQSAVEARQAMENYLARVHEAGLEGEITLVDGTPWQEIVAMAKARQVDLIVMGTHGRTGLRHVLLGSVAEKVVRQGLCPVLVSRPLADTSTSPQPC